MAQPKGTVRDWMTPDPVTITDETSLFHAYELMQDRGIRRLPVVDAGGQIAGIITRSDLLKVLPFTQGASNHADIAFALAGQTVAEVMTRAPLTVAPEEPIARVAKHMYARKISGMPVVAAGRVVGIITETDIFRMVVESWPDDQS